MTHETESPSRKKTEDPSRRSLNETRCLGSGQCFERLDDEGQEHRRLDH